MAIKRVYNGATIRKPGAYSSLKVENLTGFPLASTGTVAIVGEAVGGEPGVLDILERSQIQSAKVRYKSGPIADALGILMAPSNDPRVANGASTVIVYKTNVGTQATLALDDNTAVDMIDVTSGNYGDDENQISIVVSAGSIVDENAIIEGTIAGPFAITLTPGTLIATINGVDYTYTAGITGATGTTGSAAQYIVDMNATGTWSPSTPVVATGATGGYINLEIKTATLTTAKLDRGYIDIDATSTLDTVLGLAGLNRGVKGSRYLTITKGSTSEAAELEIGGVSQIQVIYTGSGTKCLLEIKDVTTNRKFNTTCTGAAADDISLTIGSENADGDMVSVLTVTEIVNRLNATGKYTASVTGTDPDLDGTELDYTNAYIETVAFQIKRDGQALIDYLNDQSELVDAVRKTNVYGALALLPTATYLSGGTDGTSTNTTYANGFEALETVRANIVVPLISDDDGAVTIASVNALAKSHVIKMWGTTGKSERNAYVSLLGTKAEFKAMAKSMASAYVSICGQDPLVYSHSQGVLAYLDPWAQACIKAGMQAGSAVGEPNTFKVENVSGYRVRDGSWDPKLDYDEIIEANCQLSEPLDGGGWRDVVGNTTYGVDSSFVWNRVSVGEASGFVAYDLRTNLEAVYTGTKAKTGTASSLANFIRARMSIYLKDEIIVGDDNNSGLGFRDLSIEVTGNTASINMTVTPVQGIDFILPTIYLADIRQTA